MQEEKYLLSSALEIQITCFTKYYAASTACIQVFNRNLKCGALMKAATILIFSWSLSLAMFRWLSALM